MVFFPFFSILVLGFILFVIYFAHKKRSKKIIEFYGAKINYWGELKISYQGHEFRLLRLSSGNINTGSGGSFPILCGYVRKSNSVVIANALARKYLYVFSFPKSVKFSTINKTKLAFIGFDSANTEWLQSSFIKNPEAEALALQMFSRHQSYFRIKSSWMIESFRLKKRYIFQYYVLPESVYNEPGSLKAFLDGALSLVNITGNEMDSRPKG